MLVLTRRENEKILLPDVGVTVELMSVSGNRARLGITAPENIRILREEVAADKDAVHQAISRGGTIPREFAHAMRNRLNAMNLAVEMLRLQLQNGQSDDSDELIDRIVGELKSLAALLQQEPARPVTAAGKSKRPWRALLVEDDANESKLLAGFLRMTGFEVDTAGDGADALDYLHSHERPDVVLLDMVMPRCDGPTTLGRIRRDPKLDGIKVFAVSGTSPIRCGLKTGPEGVDRWISKPLDPGDLVRQLNSELTAVHGAS